VATVEYPAPVNTASARGNSLRALMRRAGSGVQSALAVAPFGASVGRAIQRAYTVAADTRAVAREGAQFALGTGFLWQLKASVAFDLLAAVVRNAENPASAYRFAAKVHPAKIASIHFDENGVERKQSFAELDQAIDAAVDLLATHSVAGDRPVLLCFKNCPEFFVLSAAASRAGASVVPVSYRATASELAYLLGDARPALVVTDSSTHQVMCTAFAALDSARSKPALLDVSELKLAARKPAAATSAKRKRKHEAVSAEAQHIVYTSGTTGKPKAAVRKFPKKSMLSAFRIINATPLHVADVHLVACPLYHSTAFAFATLSHVLGNTVVTTAEFSPATFFALVAKHGVTTTAVVPTMLERLVALGASQDSAGAGARAGTGLRVVFCGGAALSHVLATQFMDRFGDILWNFYGATETGLVSLASPAHLRAAPGTIGKAFAGVDVRIADANGRELKTGEVGELCVASAMVVEGYRVRKAGAKAVAMKPDTMLEGYFAIGDLGSRDADGLLYLAGRSQELILSGGVNVYPAEVEEALLEHPAVAQAAVFGVATAEWGESPFAVVVRRPGHDLTMKDLRAHMKARVSGAKRPVHYAFMRELPKAATGKVNKRLLKAEFAEEISKLAE
jgi:fatty-acyl-CoA synthase